MLVNGDVCVYKLCVTHRQASLQQLQKSLRPSLTKRRKYFILCPSLVNRCKHFILCPMEATLCTNQGEIWPAGADHSSGLLVYDLLNLEN